MLFPWFSSPFPASPLPGCISRLSAVLCHHSGWCLPHLRFLTLPSGVESALCFPRLSARSAFFGPCSLPLGVPSRELGVFLGFFLCLFLYLLLCFFLCIFLCVCVSFCPRSAAGSCLCVFCPAGCLNFLSLRAVRSRLGVFRLSSPVWARPPPFPPPSIASAHQM